MIMIGSCLILIMPSKTRSKNRNKNKNPQNQNQKYDNASECKAQPGEHYCKSSLSLFHCHIFTLSQEPGDNARECEARPGEHHCQTSAHCNSQSALVIIIIGMIIICSYDHDDQVDCDHDDNEYK